VYGLGLSCVAGVLFYVLFAQSILFAGVALCFIFILMTYKKVSVFLLIGWMLFVGGYVRMYVVSTGVDTHLDTEVKNKITLSGIVISEPDRRENVVHYVVDIFESEEHIRITLRQFPRLHYGDVIAFTGTLEFPENFTTDTGMSFEYIGFLAKDDIRYIMFSPTIVVTETGKGNTVYQVIFSFKQWFVEQLGKSLKQPFGALASGILLGTKQSLGKELLAAFQNAGLVHIIVLSGFNVTIIADAIRRVFHRLPPTVSLVCTVLSIMSFAVMTGASATTVRASIMAIIAVVALRNARTYSVDRALVVAGVGMVLHNPLILIYDPGFQLSFVATLGLLYGAPFVEKRLLWITERCELRQIIATTLATQISVLPLLASMTGEISIISLVANILVLPIVPLAMGLSALLACTQWMGLWSVPLLLTTKVSLWYMAKTATYFGSLPFATIPLRW